MNEECRQAPLLKIYKTHVAGDAGTIGLDPPSLASAESIEICVLEFESGGPRVEKLRSLQGLYEYLLACGSSVDRLFLVSNITSGVVGMLGAHFGIDPQFFNESLNRKTWSGSILPSALAADRSVHFHHSQLANNGFEWDRKMCLDFVDKYSSHTTGYTH